MSTTEWDGNAPPSRRLGTFRRHVQSVEADPPSAVNVGVIDGRREPDLGRLEGIPVWNENLQLERTTFVRRSRRPLYHCQGEISAHIQRSRQHDSRPPRQLRVGTRGAACRPRRARDASAAATHQLQVRSACRRAATPRPQAAAPTPVLPRFCAVRICGAARRHAPTSFAHARRACVHAHQLAQLLV